MSGFVCVQHKPNNSAGDCRCNKKCSKKYHYSKSIYLENFIDGK